MEPFIGQIMAVGFSFPPRGWALCEGQLLGIPQHQALFSLLGTTYGGDGRTTFGLPDLRGRCIIGTGTGPGLPTHRWGERGGVDQQTLSVNQLPSHNHQIVPGQVSMGTAMAGTENGTVSVAVPSGGDLSTYNTGGQQAIYTQSPYLSINYVIALQGIFPSRN